MPSEFKTSRLTLIDGPIVNLIEESNAAGFPFMETLRREWEDRSNRFERPGEVYLEVWHSGELVAAGGLNLDPYSSAPKTGRIRHVYVLAAARRHGAGQFLVREIIRQARPLFDRLRLRTRTAEGAAFYEAIGFSRSGEDAATHVMEL